MRVRFTEDAASDLESIQALAADVDGAIAERIVDRVGGIIGLLGRWPHIGHHGTRAGTFEMVVPRLPFIIIYRINVGEPMDELVILRVYHVRRDRVSE